MSSRLLDVYLDGCQCGSLEQTSAGNLVFHYKDQYRTRPGATPLSLSMPLTVSTHKKRVVLPFLQGLLPDSDEALRAIGRRFSVSPNSPFAILEHVGADVAGAVQIIRPDEASTESVLPRNDVQPVSEADVVMMLEHSVAEYAEGTPYYDAGGRFSLAGAQPKIALHQLPDGSWGVPRDGTPTTHILKPTAGRFSRLDVVEQLSMAAAAALGNEVAQSELVRMGAWDVFVTRRYDRGVTDGRWQRLHQEDLCQALSVPPTKKYQHRDGGPGAADIAALIRSLPIAAERREAGLKFYSAFVFNVVAGCTDAHAKNYSLLLDGPNVRLAPLYDLASYAAYWDGTSRIDSAMSVGGQYGLDHIAASQLVALGSHFGLASDQSAHIVNEVRSHVVEAFESARDELPQQERTAVSVADDLIRKVRKLPLVQP